MKIQGSVHPTQPFLDKQTGKGGCLEPCLHLSEAHSQSARVWVGAGPGEDRTVTQKSQGGGKPQRSEGKERRGKIIAPFREIVDQLRSV